MEMYLETFEKIFGNHMKIKITWENGEREIVAGNNSEEFLKKLRSSLSQTFNTTLSVGNPEMIFYSLLHVRKVEFIE